MNKIDYILTGKWDLIQDLFMKEHHRWRSLKTNVLGQKQSRSRALTLETCKSDGNSTPRIAEHLGLLTMASGEEN